MLIQSKKIEIRTNSKEEIKEILSFYSKQGYGYSWDFVGLQEAVERFRNGSFLFLVVHNDSKRVGGNASSRVSPTYSFEEWKEFITPKEVEKGQIKVGDVVRIKKSVNNRYVVRNFTSLTTNNEEWYKEVKILRGLTGTVVCVDDVRALIRFSNTNTVFLSLSHLEKADYIVEKPQEIISEVKPQEVIQKVTIESKPETWTTVNAIKCGFCGDIVFSRSHYDMRWCSCGKSAIDGGKEYIKCSGVDLGKISMLKLTIPYSDNEIQNDYNYSSNKIGLYKPDSKELANFKIEEIKPTFEDSLIEGPVKKDLAYFLFDEKTLGLIRNPEVPESIKYPVIVSNDEATINQEKTLMQFRAFVKAAISKWPVWAADALMEEMLDGFINASAYLKKDPERLAFKVGKRTIEIFGKR